MIRTIAAAIAALAILCGGAVAPSTASAASEVRSTHRYGSGPSHVLDATFTPGVSGRPWVVLVHGGSWAPWNNPGRQLMGTAAAGFRKAGFQVFSIDYRDYTQAPWPAQRIDAANSLIWIKAHAAHFGINPRRGAVYGFSAGAQVAAGLGTVGPGAARVRAVVAVSGPQDVYYLRCLALAPGATTETKGVAAAAVRLAGGERSPATAARWDSMNAASYAGPGDASFLTFHAVDDRAVPFKVGEKFHADLRRAGVSSTFVRVASGGHGQAILWGNAANIKRTIDFVKAKTA